ncbi:MULTISPECIES: hypothetical protein [unclassified Niallia]
MMKLLLFEKDMAYRKRTESHKQVLYITMDITGTTIIEKKGDSLLGGED